MATHSNTTSNDGNGERSRWFLSIARLSVLWSGSWQFFLISVAGVIAWALLGPVMGYTDTWQLLINTPTTILSYLIGILILLEANRQSRESKIVHDELLRAIRNARTELIEIDEMSDEQLEAIQQELKARAQQEGGAPSDGA